MLRTACTKADSGDDQRRPRHGHQAYLALDRRIDHRPADHAGDRVASIPAGSRCPCRRRPSSGSSPRARCESRAPDAHRSPRRSRPARRDIRSRCATARIARPARRRARRCGARSDGPRAQAMTKRSRYSGCALQGCREPVGPRHQRHVQRALFQQFAQPIRHRFRQRDVHARMARHETAPGNSQTAAGPMVHITPSRSCAPSRRRKRVGGVLRRLGTRDHL